MTLEDMRVASWLTEYNSDLSDKIRQEVLQYYVYHMTLGTPEPIPNPDVSKYAELTYWDFYESELLHKITRGMPSASLTRSCLLDIAIESSAEDGEIATLTVGANDPNINPLLPQPQLA